MNTWLHEVILFLFALVVLLGIGSRAAVCCLILEHGVVVVFAMVLFLIVMIMVVEIVLHPGVGVARRQLAG